MTALPYSPAELEAVHILRVPRLLATVAAQEAEIAELRAQLAKRDAWFDNWTPTAAKINDLPLRIRAYVHDIETKCDPAGDLANLALTRDTVKMLEAKVQTLKSELALATRQALERAAQEVKWRFSDHELRAEECAQAIRAMIEEGAA